MLHNILMYSAVWVESPIKVNEVMLDDTVRHLKDDGVIFIFCLFVVIYFIATHILNLSRHISVLNSEIHLNISP